MQLTLSQKKEQGAFYTPDIWAKKAVEYIQNVLPNMEDYFFWDMAAGEGALLEVLPIECEKYATTLEAEDVDILRDKGIVANQFDFLNEDIQRLKYLPENKDELIVFTNPPYLYLPAENKSFAKVRYKTGHCESLFLHRIFNEVKPLLVCLFSKMDIFQSASHRDFRTAYKLTNRILHQFVCPSRSWGLKGEFPISFTILF